MLHRRVVFAISLSNMDWTTIITTMISVLVPTGGFLGVFTIREKKTGLMLENASKLIDGWVQLANERQEMIKDRDSKLDAKDSKIDELHKVNTDLRHDLDDARTAAAVAGVVRCDIASCTKRRPPFGSAMPFVAKEESNEEK